MKKENTKNNTMQLKEAARMLAESNSAHDYAISEIMKFLGYKKDQYLCPEDIDSDCNEWEFSRSKDDIVEKIILLKETLDANDEIERLKDKISKLK
jgi:hypothetical protein